MNATVVSLLPWYQLAEPFLLQAWGVVFTLLLTWGIAQFQTRTNIHVSDQARAAVQQAAMNAAGRILANQEGNIASLKFNVHSQAIAAEIPKLQVSVGPSLDKLGITPDRVADLIAAKIGILQSAATPGPEVKP